MTTVIRPCGRCQALEGAPQAASRKPHALAQNKDNEIARPINPPAASSPCSAETIALPSTPGTLDADAALVAALPLPLPRCHRVWSMQTEATSKPNTKFRKLKEKKTLWMFSVCPARVQLIEHVEQLLELENEMPKQFQKYTLKAKKNKYLHASQ